MKHFKGIVEYSDGTMVCIRNVQPIYNGMIGTICGKHTTDMGIQYSVSIGGAVLPCRFYATELTRIAVLSESERQGKRI